MATTNDIDLFTKARVARYVDTGPTRFAPGYDALLRITALLLAETMGTSGTALVVGAGGGNELLHLANVVPGWRFYAVDPSPEMLDLARSRVDAVGASERITWIEGVVDDVAAAPFDAATCLMTLHMLPDDGAKLSCLQAIRARLRSGARFVIAGNCIDVRQDGAPLAIERYAAYAGANGVPDDVTTAAAAYMRAGNANAVSPKRDEGLLHEAGFDDVELVYAGLSWRGWCATA